MIYDRIYIEKIKKENKKLYDLWGRKLIKLQYKLIKAIKRIMNRTYKEVLKGIKKDPLVNFNDSFREMNKYYENETDFSKIEDELNNLLALAILEWKKSLDKKLKEELKWVSLNKWFWLTTEEVEQRAQEHIAEQITRIDETTRTRIHTIINNWINNWRGYNKIAESLKKDFIISDYRARLIAAQELGQAYVNWESMQFNKYKEHFNEQGRKRRIIHQDDRTSDICRGNAEDWRILADQQHSSWHMHPLGHIGCRCREDYRLFKPEW